MSDQIKEAHANVQEKASDATEGTPVNSIQKKTEAGTDKVLGTLDGLASKVLAKGKSVIDGIFPPEKRAAFIAKLQDFMLRNPKLSAFLGMNLALTGIPLGLFVLFSLSVFIFALVVALIVGLLAAVLFTILMVGVALFFVLPTVLFTTGAACFLFLWGLGGYYILKWANGDSQGEPKQAPAGQAIGDKLDRLTGGRLSGFMESARSQNAKKDISGYNDEHTKPADTSNPQKGADVRKQITGATTTATEANNTVSNAATPVAYAKGGLKATALLQNVKYRVVYFQIPRSDSAPLQGCSKSDLRLSGHDQLYTSAIQEAVLRTCEAPTSVGTESTPLLDLRVELAAAELAGMNVEAEKPNDRTSVVGKEIFEDTLRLARAANRRGSTCFLSKEVK
ncbi:hypothetical protein BST61_g5873 [Cercospora zeina]